MPERPARLDVLNQLKVPDLWPEVTERRSRPPSGPSPFRRFAIAALALLLGGLAFVFLVRVWPGGERGTATSPTARTPVPTTTPSTGQVKGLSGEVAYKCGDTICVMNPDGSGRHELTGKTSGAPFPQWDPAWSPEGTQLAFRGYYGQGDGQYDLYVIDTTNCGIVRLTHGLNGTSPSWSPDGSQIAFASGGIAVISPEGTGLRYLTRDSSTSVDGAPSWSSNGRIALVRYPARHQFGLHFGEIYAMNADGSAVVALTHGAPGFGEPSWSLDGSNLAFVSYTGRSALIEVMNATGGGVRAVSPPTWKSFSPTWTPDGRIVFLVHQGGQRSAFIVNSDGSGLHPLYRNLGAYQIAWGAGSHEAGC